MHVDYSVCIPHTSARCAVGPKFASHFLELADDLKVFVVVLSPQRTLQASVDKLTYLYSY